MSRPSPEQGSPLLRIENLSVRLPDGAERRHALEQVDMEVRSDELVCVVGESGSGKSLTARSIMRLLPPQVKLDGGRVLLGSENLLTVDDARMRQIRGREIGMIFQEPMTALNPLMAVGKQVSEMFRIHGIEQAGRARQRVLGLFDEVGLPDPESLFHAYPHQLSGGQRQRVMIAIALALEPRLLLADEPTTALDVTTQAQVLELIRALRRKYRMGVLFITHDFGVVAEIADRVIVMRQGRIVESGPADDVLDRPQHPYTKQLIAAVPRLVPRPPRSLGEAPVVFEVNDLRKTYKPRGVFKRRHTVAVDGVSFSVRKGETLGVVGESGSGKSTLAQLVSCLLSPDSGAIRIQGVDMLRLSAGDLRRMRRSVQIVFQDPFGSLNPRFTIYDIVARGPVVHGATAAEARRKASEVLQLVGLNATALNRYPHEFSGGQRQRIAIARALALDPAVLIADESVSALDVSIQAQVLKLLEDLKSRLDLTMIFITHDLRVAAELCDSVAVMQRGRIVEYGPTNVVFSGATHQYTKELLGSVPGSQWLPPGHVPPDQDGRRPDHRAIT